MFESRQGRFSVLVVLLALLLGLMVGFGTITPDPMLGSYPDHNQLATKYDSYLGDPVQVTGTVVQTDPVIIQNDYSVWNGGHYQTGTVELTITDLSRSVTTGQTLQVYGTARPDQTIRAVNSVVVPATNYLYMYGVSALAGLWVLARLIRGWTIDPTTFAVRRRTAPLSVFTSIKARLFTEESDG